MDRFKKVPGIWYEILYQILEFNSRSRQERIMVITASESEWESISKILCSPLEHELTFLD